MSATIADPDRLAFSDEQTAGDPMRYTTASSLADYMQTEVRIPTGSLVDDAVTQPKIADAAVGVAQLNLASGSMSWTTNNASFDIDRYAYYPRVYTSTNSGIDCSIAQILANTSTSTTSSRVLAFRRSPATCTANWDYAAASDNPSVWAVTRDADGVVVALRESEDTTTDAPVSVPYDDDEDNPMPLPGYTVVNVGLPSLTVIEALYATLTATVRTAALSCTGDYVTGRGWLDAFTGLSDLSSIEARYEPSGRQWAMRCAAQAADEGVTTFYLGALVVDAGVWAVAP